IFALVASTMALEDSGLEINEKNGERVGVILGCGFGGMTTIEKQHITLLEKGPTRVSPFFIPTVCINMAAGLTAILHGAKGPNTCLATACAAGNHAIGESFRLIQRGDIDAAFCGGVEAVVAPSGLAGFSSMKAISSRNDEPEKASRPFDAQRDGFVMAEGGGVLILEELETAKKRGARIYAELIGYGLNCDAYHMTAPAPEGEGAARCMNLALRDAKLSPTDVDYINAHGTSTPLNDTNETQAIKASFKDHAYKLAVSSTKSMTGHMLGAAGGAEGVLTCLALYHGLIPPTINYEYPDPDCDLDYVPNQVREAPIKVALSNAFGFGGTNAALIFKRFED
ncbi:MAG: beta-ketoacyl-ACP synthase II, partial [Deltaproteobacteria bacterium]|nr:beta-ketoacyl-ACP synthase II [Deltaproteobacteria bacterium]